MNRYLVLVMREPEFDLSLVDAHMQFIAELRAADRIELSGGFSDKSGGAYLLRAATLDEASEIAWRDPLHLQRASRISVHEWLAK
ncbi:MAG: YciI family protein [Dokdonella sp.]